MIESFRHKGLQELFKTGQTRRIGAEYIRKCIRVLQLLDAATVPEDLDMAGLRLHSLQGTPRRWSVRISANYRITFGWREENAVEGDFEDYH